MKTQGSNNNTLNLGKKVLNISQNKTNKPWENKNKKTKIHIL